MIFINKSKLASVEIKRLTHQIENIKNNYESPRVTENHSNIEIKLSLLQNEFNLVINTNISLNNDLITKDNKLKASETEIMLLIKDKQLLENNILSLIQSNHQFKEQIEILKIENNSLIKVGQEITKSVNIYDNDLYDLLNNNNISQEKKIKDLNIY